MKPTGHQLLAEFMSCSADVLNNKKHLESLLTNAITHAGLTLKSVTSHSFDPVGITVMAIISESHIAIHTYPEANHASIDVFICAGPSDAHKRLLDHLEEGLHPQNVRVMEMQRGNPLDVKKANWMTNFTTNGFDVRYRVDNHLVSTRTKYQQLDIIENPTFGRMLFLDNEMQIAEHSAAQYADALIGPLLKNNASLGKVAILGGGDGVALRSLLDNGAQQALVADIDREVISYCKSFLPGLHDGAFDDPRASITVGEVNEFLDDNQGFDAIVSDLTTHPEALTRTERRTFLDQLFARMKASAKPGGMVTLQCCSSFDKESLTLLTELLEKHFTDVQFTETYLPMYCGTWVFASGRVA